MYTMGTPKRGLCMARRFRDPVIIIGAGAAGMMAAAAAADAGAEVLLL